MRAVIAEDQLLTREGVARVLTAGGMQVVAQVGDARALLRSVALDSPDVAVVDIRLPPTHSDEGLRAADRIRAQFPTTAVLILSQYVEAEYVAPLIMSGTTRVGYLLKDRVLEPSTLVDGVHRVVAGECVIDPALVAELIAPRTAKGALAGLSEREEEVLSLIAEGLTNAGIAQRLGLSERTVEVHAQRIFSKLGLPHADHINRRVVSALVFLGLRSATRR